jgi:hypothetical protein
VSNGMHLADRRHYRARQQAERHQHQQAGAEKPTQLAGNFAHWRRLKQDVRRGKGKRWLIGDVSLWKPTPQPQPQTHAWWDEWVANGTAGAIDGSVAPGVTSRAVAHVHGVTASCTPILVRRYFRRC